jgi:predicted NBD/HSP70 family sugar kinase
MKAFTSHVPVTIDLFGREEVIMPSVASGLDESLFNTLPRRRSTLDPGYRPLALGVRAYRQALAAHPQREDVLIGLEGAPGHLARLDLEVFPEGAGRDADNLRYVGWMLNAFLWSVGGWRVFLGGPRALCQAVAAEYEKDSRWTWDAELQGQAFGRPFEVRIVDPAEVPPARAKSLSLGGNLDGCRIGFDLGASDYKVAAVVDGELVFSEELPWEPKAHPDPEYHYRKIQDGLKLAASHLPRVDAIGGSSAGILVDNQIMVASLFRAVPQEIYAERVRPIFQRIQAEWGVPLEVINDGDVTALAGALSMEKTGILGIALGSSEAVGFLDRHGKITGWLNELAFGPIDANPEGGRDDWSGNPGVGAAYFSQQALGKLSEPAGLVFPEGIPLPEILKDVQQRAAKHDSAALAIFETIGIYLGYTLPWYAEFYDMENAMILGRVTSGVGGELILSTAKTILADEFPKLAERIDIFLPDEKSRRVGQAVAAASLPKI